MARQTTITLVDDLDGVEADEQVEFSVDGRSYEIDLSAVNAGKIARRARPVHFRGPPYRGQAQHAHRRRAVPPHFKPGAEPAIREWAIAQGMKVSERGRIPTNVLTAYHGAH